MTETRKKIGAVLVQGGGIAGVQASLDLANAGFRVYLVERSPAIGGMMSLLDKTFPTGDCATCIVSPKLVECARNLNIEILTLSELKRLEGEPGRFRATVIRRPRYVREDLCNGCGDCVEACPVNVPSEFNRGMGTRKAIAKYSAQAVPNVCDILKRGHSPCRVACPAGVNVQGYIQLIRKKEYLRAVELVRERNPLSAICGRICTHPCEAECTRAGADSAVAIRLLKRFASDREMEMIASGACALPEERTPSPDARRVAVIGSGPSGLTVAHDLAARGFAVTVYEAMPAAGGMLRWGIPEYRLPKKVLDHEIEFIRRKGVTFVCNCRVGENITLDDIRRSHDAVYLSVGAPRSRRLGVEGEDYPGVLSGVEFLGRASQGGGMWMSGRVVVIGGGNVAVDAARTALRLGAESVEMVALEQRGEMPAYTEEIVATLAEGITIRNGWGPLSILGGDRVEGVELRRCVRVFDDEGRFRPVYDESDRIAVAADAVIAAIGQTVDRAFLEHAGVETDGGGFRADPETLETSIPGVFAGGDAVTGPASVIEAVAAGKRAADSIERFLTGGNLRSPRPEDMLHPVPEDLLPKPGEVERKARRAPGELPPERRVASFAEVETGFTEEDALAEAERCLNCALCSECGECVEACGHHAVDHAMEERTVEIEIGSVILAPGFEEFLAEAKGEYGFGRYPNVLTTVQFERMLSAAGPFEGHVVRRSDGRPARRIAFIQCVGSRDTGCGNDYCSSVCCMAATKQAVVAREHQPGLDATIFSMDIRAFGKDFDQYYERAKRDSGVRYIRSMPSRIVQLPGSKDLRIRYAGERGKPVEEEFDLVVLAVGMEPGKTIRESAEALGIALNEHGFCATDRLAPLVTSRPGVFVAGAFQEPKDIPETVTQASAAASESMALLAEARNSLIVRKTYPDERDITDESPRIGVFVCHCGLNIASVVDVERVVEAASRVPDVAVAKHTMFTCSDTSLSEIRELIGTHRLNRVVVASCTPRTHEPLFRETLREAGLNPYLFELANIRDQCSWVHSAHPGAATEKAIELVRAALARARRLSPLRDSSIPVTRSALVIGGGLAGMTAALALADQDFPVHLVERSEALGGNLKNVYFTLEHRDIPAFTAELVTRVSNHPNIRLHTRTEVSAVEGHVGEFRVDMEENGTTAELRCGAVIVATGAERARPREYRYGESGAVMTQTELEERLAAGTMPPGGNVVMIQCVGSRTDERPFCSRVCCSMAVKNALMIKERSPETRVFVLYRDIRTYGFRESFYTKARKAGVVFIRYDRELPPEVTDDHGLVVRVESPDFPEPIEIEADRVVLGAGIEASDNTRLSQMLKVPLNADGFFVEAHMKLRPVDFATEGIFLCGLAHSPKLMDENISQAKAAAARAASILSKTALDVGAQVAWVDQDLCISCMTCVKACPYTAPFMNTDHKAQVEAAKCMGCGICASECPACAIQVNHFRRDQFTAMIEELFEESVG